MADILSESCLFTADYGYYHVLCCIGQLALHLATGRTKHLRTAHAFGLFALAMDYGLGYLTRGTRTVSYPNPADEALGPVGAFLFFVWYDYSAFGVIVWAAAAEDAVRSTVTKGWTTVDFADKLCLAALPFQFWSAPRLAPRLGIDARTLLLRRHSPKV